CSPRRARSSSSRDRVALTTCSIRGLSCSGSICSCIVHPRLRWRVEQGQGGITRPEQPVRTEGAISARQLAAAVPDADSGGYAEEVSQVLRSQTEGERTRRGGVAHNKSPKKCASCSG